MGRYRLYVSDSSYYSGKLEAYVRYRELDHERVEVNTRVMQDVILPATGFMKVPAMQCPDGRWLKVNHSLCDDSIRVLQSCLDIAFA